MRAYRTSAAAVNLHELLPEPRTSWSLTRRLAILGDANPRHTTGAGTRRRRSYEHQLDDHSTLLLATRIQGELVAIDRSARLRKSAPARRQARPAAAILGAELLHPWELLHAPIEGRAPALYDLRRKALALVEWCRVHEPARAHWALAQSATRARELPGATRYLLPRRAWAAFFAWRRVVRELVALLLLLHAWWERLIPARRPSSPTPKAEETRSAIGQAREAGTRYRAQWERPGVPVALRDLLRGAM